MVPVTRSIAVDNVRNIFEIGTKPTRRNVGKIPCIEYGDLETVGFILLPEGNKRWPLS